MRKIFLSSILLLTACAPSATVEESLVTTLEGQQITLEQLTNGKPAIVNFWASWCSSCKEEMPELQSVHSQFEDIAVVGVNLQEEQAVARAYAEEGGYTFISLLDPAGELKKQFGVFTQPTTLVFDSSGNELHRKDGPFTTEELLQWVEELLADTMLPEAFVGEEQAVDVKVSPVTGILSFWFEDKVRHSIPQESILSGVLPGDEIPAINSPQFIDASLATGELDDLRGIFVSLNGEAKFYPFAILNWHEIVNDTIGGEPVIVTYCPLCASAVAYKRTTSQGEDMFSVTGLLYQSNLLMRDNETGSFWDQVRGEAVVGPLTGERLTRIKSDIVSLAAVKESWPEAKVLSTDTGHVRRYDIDPYEGYDKEELIYFPVDVVDERLRGKRLVYGIEVDGMAKAYTFDAVQDEGRIQDTIGGIPILVQHDAKADRVRFTRFYPDSEKTEEILPVPIFWFSWVAQYPETALYK